MKKTSESQTEWRINKIAIHIMSLDVLLKNPDTLMVERPWLVLVEDCNTRTFINNELSFQRSILENMENLIVKNNYPEEIVFVDLPSKIVNTTDIAKLSEKYNVDVKYFYSSKITSGAVERTFRKLKDGLSFSLETTFNCKKQET